MKIYILLLTSALLMSCGSSSPTVADSMSLYSPPFLKLKAGQRVETVEGVYTVQADEVWHSDAEYQRRVREALRP